MTYEEKQELAKSLFNSRPGKVYQPPKKYEQYALTTTVEQKTINTYAGDTNLWLIDNVNRKNKTGVFINIHGGGFVIPHQERDVQFCRRIANDLNILVVDLEYRVAQDESFPVACYETYDCVKWVFDNAETLNIDTDKVIVGGHSAGGNLTVALNLIAQERKEFKVAMQILDYPVVDLHTDPEAKPGFDRNLSDPERARGFNKLYVCNEENAKNPLASPIFCTKEQCALMPQTVMFTAQNDVLCLEAERFAQMLVEAGVTVISRRFVDSRHGFVIACGDEYNEAIVMMEDYMKIILDRDIEKYLSDIQEDNDIEACAE